VNPGRAFQSGLNPIDGGVILADLGVLEAIGRKEFAERGLIGELGEACAEGHCRAAEKIQVKAFELGTQMGAKVVPREGPFGKRISAQFKDFLADGPRLS
jgi:hypothetical protein